jgi:hypothetical protein
MGSIMAYTYANRAKMSVAQQQGLQAFYLAESGLEIVSHLLVGTSPSLTCATLTGAASVTNASLLGGTFTATAIGGDLYSASSSLSAGITSTANSLSLASTTGFAAHGRVRIDTEAIDYASISGSTLIGLNRGAAGTTAASHSTGAAVSQSLCLVNVQAGIPSIAAPQYQRQLQMAVEILTGGDVWAVGDRHGNRFSIIRWGFPTAGAWNNYSEVDTSNREDLLGVSLSSTTNGWAVGKEKSNDFTILSWNGSDWSVASLGVSACDNQDLTSVATVSTAEAWAVGRRYRPSCSGSGNYRYTLMKWNGSTWSLLTPSSSPSIPSDSSSLVDLRGISVIDTNNNGLADVGFAVGDNGIILRYTGSAWVVSASGVSNNLYAVDVVSASEAWAVGSSGRILKWNGSGWSSVSSPTSTQLNAISMLDTNGNGTADVGWAVGNSGVIIYYNGSSWSSQVSSTSRDLFGVAAISGSSAWAVGENSTAFQWNGSSWVGQSSPVSNMNAICVVNGTGSGVAAGSLVGSWQPTYN